MGINPEQAKNVQRALRVAKRMGASPRETKALVAAMAVESNYRHLNYGDRDSVGVLQQRPSQGWGPAGESVETDVAQFLRAAQRANKGGGSAGQLAQAVQRSAFPGRYDQRGGEAEQLIRRYSRSGVSGGSGGGSGGNRPAREDSYRTVTTPGVDRSGDRQAAKLAYLAERGKPGALIGLKQQLDSLADTAPVSRQVRVEGDPSPERSNGVRGASLDGDRNPIRGRKGKLIGVPHSGTHTLGNWQSDNAIDLGVPNGTVLESVADGVVEKVKGGYSGGSSRFDGYQVTIRGKDGRRYFYTHLSKTHMRPGQRIRRGQAVGRSGSANGVPHLHLGVERGDARRYQ